MCDLKSAIVFKSLYNGFSHFLQNIDHIVFSSCSRTLLVHTVHIVNSRLVTRTVNHVKYSTMESPYVNTNKRCLDLIKVGIPALFIFLVLALLFVVIYTSPIERPMKCNDPSIYQPMASETDFNWVSFLFYIGLLILLLTLSISIAIEIRKSEMENKSNWKPKNNCNPLLVLLVGCAIALMVSSIVSLVLSMISGTLAPNFVQACQPAHLKMMCPLESRNLVYVNCTTATSLWIPARSASPSITATLQACMMFSTTQYIHYQTKDKRFFKYVIQAIALGMTWGTGYAIVQRNEGDWVAVLIGYFIGGSAAFSTLYLARLWLKYEFEESNPKLPLLWNEICSGTAYVTPPMFPHPTNKLSSDSAIKEFSTSSHRLDGQLIDTILA